MDELSNKEFFEREWLRVPNRKIKTTKIEREDGSVLYKHEFCSEPLVMPGDIPINGMSVLDFDLARSQNMDGAIVKYEKKKYRLKEVGKKKKKNRKRMHKGHDINE